MTLFFFVGSQWRDANPIMLVLKVYEEALVQKLNSDKSTLFFSHSTSKRHCEAPPSNTLRPSSVKILEILGLAIIGGKEEKTDFL